MWLLHFFIDRKASLASLPRIGDTLPQLSSTLKSSALNSKLTKNDSFSQLWIRLCSICSTRYAASCHINGILRRPRSTPTKQTYTLMAFINITPTLKHRYIVYSKYVFMASLQNSTTLHTQYSTTHSPLAQNSRVRLKIQAINFRRKHIKVSGLATQYLLLLQTHHSHFTPSA